MIGSSLVDVPCKGIEKHNTDGSSGGGAIQDAIWMDGRVGAFEG